MVMLRVDLSSKATRNVMLCMAYHNLSSKEKAVVKLLENVTFTEDEIDFYRSLPGNGRGSIE